MVKLVIYIYSNGCINNDDGEFNYKDNDDNNTVNDHTDNATVTANLDKSNNESTDGFFCGG